MEDKNQPEDHIKKIEFKETGPSQADLDRLRKRIWKDIDEPKIIARWWRRPYYLVAAAVSILIVSVGIGWWSNRAEQYQTAYGEIRKLTLQDGSKVTLNANSTIKLGDNLAENAVREVWLEGEAYFDIAKRNGAKFIVHTPEAEVEVLGTEFNVTTRRRNTKVVLHEGKVKLHAPNVPAILMKPGDLATVGDQEKPIQLRVVRPELHDSWKESMCILDDKPVGEIAEMLQDNYGIRITFADTSFLNKRLNGKLSLKSTEDFITNLATILDLEVEKRDDNYLFK
ncbi:FecR domain-containing protein [Dyadobacter sp. CY107]|uniref:FecR family protein n=1 Tax=Dyadobacter fanqingshengii TaxID=2906443 RepID=UPI001F44B52C|nr:FecR domain-containing protein [Dyadobacter fanqingshengii]MCF2505236.1 FecR domain-containing protein [Dyadobacter fanqingshengii]